MFNEATFAPICETNGSCPILLSDICCSVLKMTQWGENMENRKNTLVIFSELKFLIMASRQTADFGFNQGILIHTDKRWVSDSVKNNFYIIV